MKTIREDIFNEIVNKNFSLLSTHGQNYLKDNDILEMMKTYSTHTDSDIIIEIGTGAGVLTSKLCETEKKVISYESDDRIYNIVKKLEKEFPNLSLIRQDFLKSALPINKKYSVIANIPYSVTSEILKKLLTNINLPEKILVMVQKEFAVKVVKCNP
ncbi:MAG: rRNA adenine N-6-methyltransferase family protein, partial [Candidatus Muiribacteriota bacterium]